MTTETVLVSTDWDPESPITTTVAGAWSQNWIAGFEGNSTTKVNKTALAADLAPWILLDSASVSSVSSIDFPTVFTTSYDIYRIFVWDIIPATNGVNLYLRVSIDGSTFLTTSIYWQDYSGTGATSSRFNISGAASLYNSVYMPSHFEITFFQPTDAANYKGMASIGLARTSTSVTKVNLAGSVQDNSNDLTGFQLVMSSGNIAEGKVAIYGLRK